MSNVFRLCTNPQGIERFFGVPDSLRGVALYLYNVHVISIIEITLIVAQNLTEWKCYSCLFMLSPLQGARKWGKVFFGDTPAEN